MSDPTSTSNGELDFFEKSGNVNRIIIALVAVCACLALVDLLYENPHPHFDIETSFAFQAWFGFVAFVGAVFLGRLLRVFVQRPEDYYDSGFEGTASTPMDSQEATSEPQAASVKRKKTKKGKRR